MSSIILQGQTLPGELNTKWGISGSTSFKIIPRQQQVEGVRMQQTAVGFSQSSPSQVSVMMKTYNIEEISTEKTLQKMVNYCFKYLGTVGTLYAGSRQIANTAALSNVAPWFDHKKGWGIAWTFILIDKGQNTMNYYEKLRNPSFDAIYGTTIAQWTLTPGTSGTMEQSQLFGIEELGNGQFCIKSVKGTTDCYALSQYISKITGASADSYIYTYLKFSVNVIFQADNTERTSSTVKLTARRHDINSTTAFESSFTVYSGRAEKLSIMCPLSILYPNSYFDTLEFKIENTGSTGDTMFFDKCKLQEVIL